MANTTIAHPQIASREEWLKARKALLEREKELTRTRDQLNADRRRLPMVKVDKTYVFEGPKGNISLRDLFGDQTQLIVYHFMFAPDWEKGCSGCTGFVNALGDLSMLEERNSRFVLISRAPLPKLEAYKEKNGWEWPWYSSFDSDFNYDFHVTLDESVAPAEYNYRTLEEWIKLRGEAWGGFEGEMPGLSVFFRLGDDVYHAYSSFGRGVENLTDSYALLDVTPYGRQEDWEDSPEGWPQKPTYG